MIKKFLKLIFGRREYVIHHHIHIHSEVPFITVPAAPNAYPSSPPSTRSVHQAEIEPEIDFGKVDVPEADFGNETT